MKSLLRRVRTFPPIPSFILWYRRFRGKSGVTRVLSSRQAVEKRYHAQSSQPHPSAFLTRLSGGRVVAQPIAVLGPDYALLWEFSPQLQRRPATSSTFWKKPPNARFIQGESLFAAVDGFSYYHWLFGALPKMLLARNQTSIDKIIVNPRHKGQINFQTESLKLLEIATDRIIWLNRGMHLHCELLLLPSEPCTADQTRLTPWARELLLDLFLPLIAKLEIPNIPEQIYITRAQARRRQLTNETEVSDALQKAGYTPVVLESLPLLHQIKYLASARSVVGLHGAGLANAIFCRPGTQLIEITSNFWSNPCFKHLAHLCGLNYSAVPGQGVPGTRVGFAADVKVDPERLIAATSKPAQRTGAQGYREPR